MTRKRFIRLLMADGYDRNSAHAYVRFVNANGKSYKTAYDTYLSVRRFGDIARGACDAIVGGLAFLGGLCQGVTDGFSALAASLRAFTEGQHYED